MDVYMHIASPINRGSKSWHLRRRHVSDDGQDRTAIFLFSSYNIRSILPPSPRCTFSTRPAIIKTMINILDHEDDAFKCKAVPAQEH